MRCAVYARKSTEQNGLADEARSVTRQVEQARAFAAGRGWTVADEHVYVDDGVSGAEFAKRPGFLRLMNALKPKPAFEALIMSEESRLGREQIETAYALKQLITSGVQVWFYLDNRQRTLDSPMEKAMLALQGMADEMEREKARQRTYDAMQRKAQAGHVTGGRVFGYDNVRTDTGAVVRVVNEREAAVVRRIFQLCAEGHGMRGIVHRLNAEAAPCARPQRGRPAGWAPSSVREVLYRPLNRGEVVWNRSRKRDTWGQARQQARPQSDWLRRDAPELRVIDDAVWQAAHARLAQSRALYLRGNERAGVGTSAARHRVEVSPRRPDALRGVRLWHVRAFAQPRHAPRLLLRLHRLPPARATRLREPVRAADGGDRRGGAVGDPRAGAVARHLGGRH
jgi:DNA invertase Pin-like site-specific DNA recombinase